MGIVKYFTFYNENIMQHSILQFYNEKKYYAAFNFEINPTLSSRVDANGLVLSRKMYKGLLYTLNSLH